MTLLDQHTWRILKHLHHTMATQASTRIAAGERMSPQAYLASPAPAQQGQTGMQLAEVSAAFIAQLLAQPEGDRLLAKYLADALIEGSLIQQQIASEHGLNATYTFCVQEALLPGTDAQSPQRPALMVLIGARTFTLPVFHLIEELPDGTRQCHLRAFPELQEIEVVQHMLQARMQQHGGTVH